MSVQAISWAFAQDVRDPDTGKPSAGAKFVLVAMANYAGDEGTCYPSEKRLADDTGQGVRTVRRHLAVLEQAGFIEGRERRRSDGTRKSNEYLLLLPHIKRGRAREQAKSRADQPAKLAAGPTGQSEQINRPITTDQPAKLAGHEPSVREPSDREPSLPLVPPAAEPPAPPEPTAPDGEGGREEVVPTGNGTPDAELPEVYAAWLAVQDLPPDRRELFDRQVLRLADGADLEAWTHRDTGFVVPAEERPELLEEGLRLVSLGTSETPRGGVMYAVAKRCRSRPLPGTEAAAVAASGRAETPGAGRTAPVSGGLGEIDATEVLLRTLAPHVRQNLQRTAREKAGEGAAEAEVRRVLGELVVVHVKHHGSGDARASPALR